MNYFFLFLWGVLAGVSSGIFGIGGGVVLVPAQVFHQVQPVQAVATSSLAIFITALAGSYRYYREKMLSPDIAIKIGIPAAISAQIGVIIANLIQPWILLLLFGFFLWINIALMLLKSKQEISKKQSQKPAGLFFAYTLTGLAGGILTGLFGVGGGLLMVPLQILLLGIEMKMAIANSLGIIVFSSLAAVIGHAMAGTVLFSYGICMGVGGLAGTQLGTRIMIRLPKTALKVILLTATFLISLSILYNAYLSYHHAQ